MPGWQARKDRFGRWLCNQGRLLFAGMFFLPGLCASAALVLYLVDIPACLGPWWQLALGVVIGIVAWVVISETLCRPLVRADTSGPGRYEHFRLRYFQLDARFRGLRVLTPGWGAATKSIPVGEAQALVCALHRDLICHGRLERQWRWIHATGYLNLWRAIHRAEEAMIEFEDPNRLASMALVDLDRMGAVELADAKHLVSALTNLVKGERGKPAGRPLPDRCHKPENRALLRGARFTINSTLEDLTSGLIGLRNYLFTAVVVTGFASLGVVGLAIIEHASRSVVAVATAYSLVGATVGMLWELYATSRRKKPTAEDYGFGIVRLLAVPLMSGLAGVLGVLLTRVGATYAGVGTTASTTAPPLSQVFGYAEFSSGLVVAAAFGLSPARVFSNLRGRADLYKDDIEKLTPGGTSTSG